MAAMRNHAVLGCGCGCSSGKKHNKRRALALCGAGCLFCGGAGCGADARHRRVLWRLWLEVLALLAGCCVVFCVSVLLVG
jgi:hypothetical protein